MVVSVVPVVKGVFSGRPTLDLLKVERGSRVWVIWRVRDETLRFGEFQALHLFTTELNKSEDELKLLVLHSYHAKGTSIHPIADRHAWKKRLPLLQPLRFEE